MAPTNVLPVLPASYNLGERIGNVSRDSAQIMSEFMDFDCIRLNERNKYGDGFMFVCRLIEDSNHTCAGFAIEVVVLSKNSDSWTDLFIEILTEKNVVCKKMNQLKKKKP